ncbi:MAG: EamA family transporter, partial [Thermomicrobiales bacterium]|nr:EamA family transporter [Thermomicrobiales bacterium]
MLPIGLGLGAAASIAVSSSVAGLASRRRTPYVVAFWSQIVQLAVCLVLIMALRPGRLDGQTLAGVAAGVVGGLGMALNYQAMAAGALSLVAPITACSVVVPVIFSVATGESLAPLAAAGIVAIIAGVVIASLQKAPIPEDPTDTTPAGDRRALALAIGAALAYGGFFILIDFAPDAPGLGTLWTAIGVRTGGVAVQTLLLLANRTSGVGLGPVAPFVVVSGLLDFSSLLLISFGAMTASYALVTALVG